MILYNYSIPDSLYSFNIFTYISGNSWYGLEIGKSTPEALERIRTTIGHTDLEYSRVVSIIS